MARPIQSIEDPMIRRALRELQEQIVELQARVGITNVVTITNPADEIPVILSADFPAASALPNRLVIQDRSSDATAKNPAILVSRQKTDGTYAYMTVVKSD